MIWLWIPGVCLLWWVWNKRQSIRLYWKLGSIQPALPFIGHGHLFMKDRQRILKNLFAIGDHALSNGGLSSIWVLNQFYVILADAVDAEFVLKNYLEKDDHTKILRMFTRTSSIFAPVAIWRPRRKIVVKLLSHKNVSKFEPVIVYGSETLMEQLRPLVGKGSFSIWDHFSTFAVKSVCMTILGIDLKGQTHKLKSALKDIMTYAANTILDIRYRSEFLLKISHVYKLFLQCDQVIEDVLNAALEKHEAEFGSNEGEDSTLDEEQRFSLMHMFTKLKKQLALDRSTLHDETLALLIAASDTTAVVSAMVSVALAQRPHIQEKVYKELKEVFGDSDRPVTIEDLPRLKYLSAVIKETLRLYPAVPHISRTALVDIDLPSGVTVPKGTNMLISIYALHRNPKYWGPDADQFRPERFLEGSNETENITFFGFSYGPRGCPGIQYGMMSIKTVLSTMLRKYRLLPAAASETSLRLLFGITTIDADGFQVRIEAR